MARVYRATIRGHYTDGTLVQPSLHYQTDLDAGQNEPDPSDVAGEIWAHIGAAVTTLWPTIVILDELVVAEQVLKPNIGVAGSHNLGFAGGLPVASEDLPRELVGIINLHTGTSSRSARGYTTLPGGGS